MAVKSISVFNGFARRQNGLDAKKYQREVNYSKKYKPSLDSYKFSRDWSDKNNGEK